MADFLGMMKQAAQLQSKMQAMQEELGNVEVEGISGGGLVAVRMTAKMEVKGVKIDPSLMKAEEREVLEDLLVTAHNDARRKAEAYTAAAGVKLGRVIFIRDATAGTPRPMAARMMASQGVPIAPGEQELEASVSVTYGLE